MTCARPSSHPHRHQEEGLDDLIDDAGEHVHDAADMIAMRRQM